MIEIKFAKDKGLRYNKDRVKIDTDFSDNISSTPDLPDNSFHRQ